MITKILKGLAIFGAGCFAGYIVTTKMLEKKYAKLAQEEIDSVKEVLSRTSAERLARQFERAKTMSEVSVVDPGKVMAKGTNDHEYNKSRIAYHEMAKENIRKRWDEDSGKARVMDEEEEDDDPETDAAGYSEDDYKDEYVERDLTGIDRTSPYVISDKEFCEEFPHHDKISLYYYRGDRTLCGEAEEVISDVDGMIGNDVCDILRVENTAWVRNEPLCTDFEICAVNGSYAEIVAGFGTERKMSLRESEEENGRNIQGKAMSPREKYNRKNSKRWDEEDDE